MTPPTASADATLARIHALLDEGRRLPPGEEQLSLYARAHALDLNDAQAMSHHGAALAVVRKRYEQGIVFCEEAVRRMGPQPRLLLNLGRAYLAARNKREGVRALRRAMARGGDKDPEILRELLALGLRRTPVIPFLPRAFFLNRWLGALRHRLTARSRDDDPLQPLPAELGTVSGDVGTQQQALAQELAALPPVPDSESAVPARDGLALGGRPEHNPDAFDPDAR